ncbi:hypothetical protein PanWU01x14_304090 [Parasponia andersonii]|uniref:Uncharacterized protein n=1 Tax=Parasponia andersonii TaxID=3476 RepID=A0A2P5ASQ6_PARAD|nr:hypothetical protein PanWU01x14_304090 [Parasponia andersonii]
MAFEYFYCYLEFQKLHYLEFDDDSTSEAFNVDGSPSLPTLTSAAATSTEPLEASTFSGNNVLIMSCLERVVVIFTCMASGHALNEQCPPKLTITKGLSIFLTALAINFTF